MTVRGHDLNAIEACILRVRGSGTILVDDTGDLFRLQCPMWRRLHEAVGSYHENAWIRPISWIDGSRDWLLSRHRRVSRAARMPQLSEHMAALGMNGVRDTHPA